MLPLRIWWCCCLNRHQLCRVASPAHLMVWPGCCQASVSVIKTRQVCVCFSLLSSAMCPSAAPPKPLPAAALRTSCTSKFKPVPWHFTHLSLMPLYQLLHLAFLFFIVFLLPTWLVEQSGRPLSLPANDLETFWKVNLKSLPNLGSKATTPVAKPAARLMIQRRGLA